jgi:AraC family transcriptional regulator
MNRGILTKINYAKRMNVIIEYIQAHLNEEMDLKKLADMSNFSIYHFHRIFKRIQQETLAAYITRNRIERAAYLLRYTRLPIGAIAFNVGFEFPSSLSKSFKQSYNLSPAAYRLNTSYSIIKRIKKQLDAETISPRMVTLKSKNVIYIRLVGPYNILKHPEIWHRLKHFAKEQNLLSDKIEYIGIYHDDISVTEADKLRSDICLSIHKPIQAQEEIGVKQIQGGKYAVFLYEGPFNNAHAIYDQIFNEWLPGSGYELRELPLFEKYFNDPVNTKHGSIKTEIYLPVK